MRVIAPLAFLLVLGTAAQEGGPLKLELRVPKRTFRTGEEIRLIVSARNKGGTAIIFNPAVVRSTYAISIWEKGGGLLKPRNDVIIEQPWIFCNFAMLPPGATVITEVPLNSRDAYAYLGRYDIRAGSYCAQVFYLTEYLGEVPGLECVRFFKRSEFVRAAASNQVCFQVATGFDGGDAQ